MKDAKRKMLSAMSGSPCEKVCHPFSLVRKDIKFGADGIAHRDAKKTFLALDQMPSSFVAVVSIDCIRKPLNSIDIRIAKKHHRIKTTRVSENFQMRVKGLEFSRKSRK
jgi:hypothetical protein